MGNMFNKVKCDMFSRTLEHDFDAICITTNGFYTKHLQAVMGRGCALTASVLQPSLKQKLGLHLFNYGNHAFLMNNSFNHPKENYITKLFTFPVKPQYGKHTDKTVKSMAKTAMQYSDKKPGWAVVAQLDIIEQSCIELVVLAEQYNLQNIAIPKAGCGAGELKWKKVKPIFKKHFDNRFTVVELPK